MGIILKLIIVTVILVDYIHYNRLPISFPFELQTRENMLQMYIHGIKGKRDSI